jgi:hypothetical protein
LEQKGEVDDGQNTAGSKPVSAAGEP